MSFEGKVVLVTGASRGIGAAIFDAFLDKGACVIGTATSEKGVESIKARCEAKGLSGHGMVMDVTDTESVTAGIKSIQAEHGAIEVLVNNAGITRDNLMARLSEEDVMAVLDANLVGAYRTTKAVIRSMLKARTGRIIQIGSVIGTMGNAGQANYAASKAGLVGLTQSLAKELGPRNITCNVVAPGFITTEMTDAMTEQAKAGLLAHIPLNRMGAPDDIAKAVLFLASDSADYITGAVLPVNGGMHMSH